MATFTHAKQIMEKIQTGFKPERAKGAGLLVQYLVSGENGGNWIITIKDGKCTIDDGIAPEPEATCKVSDVVLLAIANGKMNAMQAVLTGKMKIIGNLATMQKLQKWST